MDGKRNSKEENQEWRKYEKFDFDSEMTEWKKNVILHFMEEVEGNWNKREGRERRKEEREKVEREKKVGKREGREREMKNIFMNGKHTWIH